MLKIGTKRRRTVAQIEADKEEAMFKEQDQAAKLVELAELRARIDHAEQTAQNNKAAAELMSQMINAVHIKQDTGNSIILNSQNG